MRHSPPSRKPVLPPTGRLIAVEGLDGAGKTTLSRALANALAAEWTTTPDPSLREIGARLEASYAGAPHGRVLFYASTVMALSERSLSHLSAGHTLVVDRYWLSTWAYSRLLSSPPDLASIERVLRPADVTIYVEASDAARRERLDVRRASVLDRSTLDAEVALRLRRAYDEGLTRPIAGQVIRVQSDRLSCEEVFARALDAYGQDLSSPLLGGESALRRRRPGFRIRCTNLVGCDPPWMRRSPRRKTARG